MAADDKENVVGIFGGPVRAKGEPDPGLISALEKLLQMAKAGELQSFVGCGFDAGGDRVSCWAGGFLENVYEFRGSLAWLESEYVHRVTTVLPEEQHP